MSSTSLRRNFIAFAYRILSIFLTVMTILAGRAYAGANDIQFINPLDRYSVSCKEKVLRSLGWTVEQDPTIWRPEFVHDPECYNTMEPQGWRPHNILKVPSRLWNQFQYGPEILTATKKTPIYGPPALTPNLVLDQALRSDGSRCLFQQKYNRAIGSTINRLQHDWKFWWPFFWRRNIVLKGVPYWHATKCMSAVANGGVNICYMPEQKHLSQALENLKSKWNLTSWVFADCREGMQVAQYISVAKVFGSNLESAFLDTRFRQSGPVLNEGFYLGPDALASKSAVFGEYASGTFNSPQTHVTMDLSGVARAELGPEAFTGAMGQIESVKGARYIDDSNNEIDNFIVYKTDLAALHSLIARRGIRGFDGLLRKIWWEAIYLRANTNVNALKFLESHYLNKPKTSSRLLPSNRLPLGLHAFIAPLFEIPYITRIYVRLAKELNDPFLRDTLVYEQPFGVKSLADFVLRLAIKNPRTPFKIRFYSDTIHGEIYDRWLMAKLNQCNRP